MVALVSCAQEGRAEEYIPSACSRAALDLARLRKQRLSGCETVENTPHPLMRSRVRNLAFFKADSIRISFFYVSFEYDGGWRLVFFLFGPALA